MASASSKIILRNDSRLGNLYAGLREVTKSIKSSFSTNESGLWQEEEEEEEEE